MKQKTIYMYIFNTFLSAQITNFIKFLIMSTLIKD